MEGGQPNSFVDAPVYTNSSDRLITVNRVYGIFTVLVVLTSSILCIIQAISDHYRYLILVNIILSSFLAVVNVFWYKREHLSAEKIWFLILIYTVVVLQCLTSDIYIFMNIKDSISTSTTTQHPHPASYITNHSTRTTTHHHDGIY